MTRVAAISKEVIDDLSNLIVTEQHSLSTYCCKAMTLNQRDLENIEQFEHTI